MKLKAIVLSFLASLALAASLPAADKGHSHDNDQKKAGPNGGRILTKLEPHAEFFVTAERKVQITFLGKDGKAIAPAAQVVTVTAGKRSAPTKLSFAPSGNTLISDVALPAGNDFPTVVQIKATPDAKAVNEKFNLDLSKCSDCGHGEYACTCGH